jgi:hypothetical protein
MTDHIGQQTMELATWKLTGVLPSAEQIRDMATSGTATPVVVTDNDERARTVDLFPEDLAREMRFDDPQPLHEALAAAKWGPDSSSPPAVERTVEMPGNGVVVFVPDEDGKDRLGVLYNAFRYRNAYEEKERIKVVMVWAPEPLPTTVAALQIARAGRPA